VSVFAIGDIHGEASKLDDLLAVLPRGEHDTTVFLGDYIDRGPDSAAAVRRVLAEADALPERTVLLWGNHEDMAASHFRVAAPSGFHYDSFDWFRNGGIAALESYGLAVPDLFVAPCPDDLGQLFSRLKIFWRDPESGAIFVHAGVLPNEEPEAADPSTLLWVRNEFLNAPPVHGRMVIHGHTPFPAPRVRSDKIGIDTGAFRGGPLTAIQWPEGRFFQANGSGRVATFSCQEIR
jgi:serine/threonine protein phosphatase 1